MKRFFTVVCFLIIVVMLVSACSKPTVTPSPSPSTTPTTKPAATPAPTTAPTPKPTPTTAPAGSVSIKVSGFGGTGHVARLMLEDWMNIVKKKTTQVNFEYWPGESLFTMKENLKALNDNVIQVGHITVVYEPASFKLYGSVSNMPFNYDYDKFGKHYRDPGGFFDWVKPYYEGPYDIKYVATGLVPQYDLWMRKGPIRKLEDFKGKIIMATGSEKDFFIKVGASPTLLPTGDRYPAMQKGTIDGVCMTPSTAMSLKIDELTKYLTKVGLVMGFSDTGMNRTFYNKLSPDIRKILDDSWLEAEKNHIGRALNALAEQYETVKKRPGLEFYELPNEEKSRWVQAAKPIQEEIAAKFPQEWATFSKIWPSIGPD